jgi:hypothetical protein
MKDSDEAFLQALETCALPESDFGHTAHVRAGYLYIRGADFASALSRLQRTIRAYASSLGWPDRYHETITVAYLALIQQHIAERGDGGDWKGFERDNPELFERDLLLRFYSRSRLESGLARRLFLLPDRQRHGADVNGTTRPAS